MPTDLQKGKAPAAPQSDPDIFQVTLHAPDRDSLAKLVRQRGLDLDHSHPHRRGEKASRAIEINAYLTETQIRELKQEGWKLKVGPNFSAIGRERQKEVGKGDRFEGGKIRPKGLGKKTGKEC